MTALKIQAVSHNTTHPIIADSNSTFNSLCIVNGLSLLILFQYIFECSLSGDIPGILCGLCHGGSLSEQDTMEGQRYPVHQACIAVRSQLCINIALLLHVVMLILPVNNALSLMQGNETVVEYLYQNGAKVNVSDERGMTPLHLAVLNDDTG